MGPGCFYPGNPSVNPEPVRLPELQWGRDVSIPEIRPPAPRPAITSMASMGPGCFYPGNSATAAATYGMWALQWGRDVSIPEMTYRDRRRLPLAGFNGAGMFLSRKWSWWSGAAGRLEASMGPGCFYPGNQGFHQ